MLCRLPASPDRRHAWLPHLTTQQARSGTPAGQGSPTRNDAGGARVVDAIVEVVDTARVHNLLAADVGAGDGANACQRLVQQQFRWVDKC